MLSDRDVSGFGPCFVGGVFGMPKRFLGCQSEDDNVVFQFNLDVKILVEQRRDGFVILFGYVYG